MPNWQSDSISDLEGKTTIVTSAKPELGFETVKAFCQRHATVILASRDVQQGEEERNRIFDFSR